MKPYMSIVLKILKEFKVNYILDAPGGNGFLRKMLHTSIKIDSIDLFATSAEGYNKLIQHDLDKGLPEGLPKYDAIVSCEGIEHFGNPLLFLKDCNKHLKKNGILIITTPNVWYPASKLKYLTRGFFPSFPSLAGRIERGTHMHIMPWSFPQLYLFLSLSGFDQIKIIDSGERKPNHFFEKIIGFPQKFYCKQKFKSSQTQEEKNYWSQVGSSQSLYGRGLVVIGFKK